MGAATERRGHATWAVIPTPTRPASAQAVSRALAPGAVTEFPRLRRLRRRRYLRAPARWAAIPTPTRLAAALTCPTAPPVVAAMVAAESVEADMAPMQTRMPSSTPRSSVAQHLLVSHEQ